MGAEDQFLVVLVAAVDVLGRCTITGHTWRDPFPGIPSLLGTVNTIGFSASFGVLLASGFKLPKYTLTTLFFFYPIIQTLTRNFAGVWRDIAEICSLRLQMS